MLRRVSFQDVSGFARRFLLGAIQDGRWSTRWRERSSGRDKSIAVDIIDFDIFPVLDAAGEFIFLS